VSAASFSGEFELLFGMNQSAPGAKHRRPRLVHPHTRREHSGLEEVVEHMIRRRLGARPLGRGLHEGVRAGGMRLGGGRGGGGR
jgi:hypothetical protein